MLGRFDPGAAASPLVGGLAHLAMSAIYGILFALSWRLLLSRWLGRVPLWLTGLAYGLILLLAATAVGLPLSDSPLKEIPPTAFYGRSRYLRSWRLDMAWRLSSRIGHNRGQ
jgi:uncharacterized membrane protein YagU involved in acid resistance